MATPDEGRGGLVRFRAAGGPLGAGLRAAAAASEYRSRFERWDRRATVRSSPRRVLEAADPDPVYFPPELAPVTSHPLALERGEDARRHLLVHRLYQYLDFTVELEDSAVMPVTSRIARGRAGLHLPEPMRVDAFKISTDEAWHAQFSDDLVRQVQSATGIERRAGERPQFVDRLAEIRRRLDPDLHGIHELLFAVVSETLISTILSDLPNDRRLPHAVREVVADHAVDEGRHHAFFRGLLGFLWHELSGDQRRRIGPWVPELIFAFLEPDYRATALALADVGLSSEEIEGVLRESLPDEQVRRDVADAAGSTVQYFRAVGALDDPETRDAFAAARLLPEC